MKSDLDPAMPDASALARQLSAISLGDMVVVALSPGSVAFAFDLVKRLGCELDLLLVETIGAPGEPGRRIGMVIDLDTPYVMVDEQLARECHVPPGYLNTERYRLLAEIERKHRMYLGDTDTARHDYSGKDIVVIDHGVEDAVLEPVIRQFSSSGAVSVRVVKKSIGDATIADRDVARAMREARRIRSLLH